MAEEEEEDQEKGDEHAQLQTKHLVVVLFISLSSPAQGLY